MQYHIFKYIKFEVLLNFRIASLLDPTGGMGGEHSLVVFQGAENISYGSKSQYQKR
jgi:hypothetical protein